MNGIYKRLQAAVSTRFENVLRAQAFVKIVMIVVASAIAGVAQFAHIVDSGKIDWWSIAGIAAAVIAGLGGVVLTLGEENGAEELKVATDALEEARLVRDQSTLLNEDSAILYDDLLRSNNLYQAMSIMRATVERVAFERESDLVLSLDTLFEVATRHLMVAADFTPDVVWTMCAYKTIDESDGKALKLVSHARAIKCGKERARVWPIGRGPAGIALANEQEVIVGDMLDPSLATLLALSDDMKRSQDKDRYRSVVAVPIVVGRGPGIWGVVVASSDQAEHFVDDEGRAGPVEAVRALAGMCALMVVTCGNNDTISN